MSTSDAVWSEQNTTPDKIESALRALLAERHAESESFVPARVLNMIAFVDDEWSGEIANRLRGVGRYAASRLIVLSFDPKRERLDARVSVASEQNPEPGQMAVLRETVIVRIGERHLDDLFTIADPLVVTDLPTLLWSPHGHPEAVDALVSLAQATLIDSIDEPVWRDALDRACRLSEQLYVVDLAWLRSTPWRERLAAAFDPPAMRPALGGLTEVKVRHHPDSTVAAMLLLGWLASRLHWKLAHAEIVSSDRREGALGGKAQSNGHEIKLELRADDSLSVPGLAGLELHSASGLELCLDRGPGGLHARRTDEAGQHGREWTVLGASRGESGILGEGIRQALLRDPTYGPALAAAREMLPDEQALVSGSGRG